MSIGQHIASMAVGALTVASGLAIWWLFKRCMVHRANAHARVQRRLLEHSERMVKEQHIEPQPNSWKPYRSPDLEALRQRAFRYTQDHQAEVHRRRAEAEDRAKIEAGIPIGTSGVTATD